MDRTRRITSNEIKFGSPWLVDDSPVVSLSFTADFEQKFFVARIKWALLEKREAVDFAVGKAKAIDGFSLKLA